MYMIHSTLEIIGPGRIWFAFYALIGQVIVISALEAATLILAVYFAKMSSIVKLPILLVIGILAIQKSLIQLLNLCT